ELRANIAELRPKLPAEIKPVEGYTEQQAAPIVMATERLAYGWRENNVALANQGIRDLAALLPAINPQQYPPIGKRQTELFYNHTYNGTIVGVFLYFMAMALFLVAAVGGVNKAWFPGILFFTVAVFVHAAYMILRWWLAGRIP